MQKLLVLDCASDFGQKTSFLLINLKSFQITRFALPINPNSAIADRESFVLSDRDNQMVVFKIKNLVILQNPRTN